MEDQKTILISDAIHGSIQISYLEKQIISTQAFNRLHNIMQNSTVFLTYPSNQTKRFSHSLGSMHLGSQMFYHCIVNANPTIKDELLEAVKISVKYILTEQESQTALNRCLGDFAKVVDKLDFKEIIEEPLYKSNTPSIIGETQIFLYQILFQSIRCAALLHDIGHPPFSHITEYALQKLSKTISLKKELLTDRQKFFLESIDYSGNDQLHERIGSKIASRLLYSIIPNIIPQTEEEAYQIIFYWFIYRFTKAILSEETNFFSDIHRLISSAIDCDRLDYVTRDLLNSGFTSGKIEYDRLINSMKLIKNNGRFGFCVSIRSLSTVDDFFRRRLQLYRYIILHHRVVKTDYLLEQIIVQLSLDYLNDQTKESDDDQVLPSNISGLWKAIRNVYSYTSYFNALIQWDDAWLLTVLKQQFFAKYINMDDKVKYQLEEILSNRKNYTSIIKRSDDFLEIDNVVVKNFPLGLEGIIKVVDEEFKGNLEKLLKQTDNLSNGLYLNRINKEIFQLLQKEDLFKECISHTITEYVKTYQAIDCMVIFKKLKTGLEEPPFLYKDNDLISIDNVSGLSQNLDILSMTFPTFFIYIKEDPKIKINKIQFLQSLGELISTELINELNKLFLK